MLMAFSIILMFVGLGAFCVLLYNCAVYALPVIVGLEVGYWAITTGAGAIGGIVIGFLTGGIVFALGQAIFGLSRSNIVRYLTVLAFVIPAILAGYDIVFELSEFGMTSNLWRHAFAVIGAIVIGCTAFMRLVTPIDNPHTNATV